MMIQHFRESACAFVRISVFLVVVGAPLLAQNPAPPAATPESEPTACIGLEAHRFDFWPGHWEVESRRRDATGRWRVTTNVWRAQTVLGGCAFADYADGDFGTGHLRGMGTRFYDAAAKKWVITWLSTENPGVLGVWTGGFDKTGDAEFLMDRETSAGPIRSRIRWWNIKADTAKWEHAISRDGGATWQSTWMMTFKRSSISHK